MAKFYVGQRVKLARHAHDWGRIDGKVMSGSVAVGDEGAVLGTDSQPNRGFVPAHFPRVSVHLDKLGAHGMAPESVWEPIQPQGAAPSEFTTLADLLTSLGAEAKA